MNSSLSGAESGAVAAPVADGGSGGGHGSVPRDLTFICRNLSNPNGTKPGTAPQAAEDTDFGAVLYIVVVLTFYSFGIIVMIVKYLKTEKKEMEEEMVLDSFFKGIPDKRIENEKEAVNRVAIQAFHTLTTSKQPRGFPQSAQESSPERSPAPANHQRKLLSPAAYRRERYSIQPMYIETSRQLDDDELSDNDDDTEDNKSKDENYNMDRLSRSKKRCYILDDENALGAMNQHDESKNVRNESKPHKYVLFSDAVNPCWTKNNYDDRDGGGMRHKYTGQDYNAPSAFSQPSKKDSTDVSEQNTSSLSLHEIRLPLNSNATEGDSSDTEIKFSNSSSPKPNRNTTAVDTHAANTHNFSQNSFSTPKDKLNKNAGKGFLSTRKTSKGVMMKLPLGSPDLGVERNLLRMSSLEKISGDGSSYDSSSSLLTRIHLAETFTPPLKTKNNLKDLSNSKSVSSGNCLSSIRYDNGANCSSSLSQPSTLEEEDAVRTKNHDEKLKLTAGKNVPSMQPTYDSTASTTGLTPKVNILDSSCGRQGSNKACLVTDL